MDDLELLPVYRPQRKTGVTTPRSLAQQIVAPVRMHEQEAFTERVAAAALANDGSFLAGLDEHERVLAVQILRELAESPDMQSLTLDKLWEIDYWEKPVSIEEFLENPYYMGGDQTKELYPTWRKELYKLFAPGARYTEWVLGGAIGVGKGQPVDGKVCTPSGWRRVGDIKKGDYVTGSDGKPTKVTGVFPRGVLPVWRVKFTDGSSLVVDRDHLWNVQSPSSKHRGRGWKTLSTRELIKDLRAPTGSLKWHIPILSEPVQYSKARTTIDPYVVGALIGDGGLTGDTIMFSTMDRFILDKVVNLSGLTAKKANKVSKCDYRLVWGPAGGGNGKGPLNPVSYDLRKLGMRVGSPEKRIPRVYMQSSAEDRVELLRGIMDTDGWHQGKSVCLSTSSEGLCDDVVELVNSLGGTTSRSRKKAYLNGKRCRDAHILCLRTPFNPFSLPRKARKWKPVKYTPCRLISEIVPEGHASVVCIQVAASDQLYVADHHIVTHNTSVAVLANQYVVYRNACLRDPHKYYGLMKGNDIVYIVFSLTGAQANEVGYGKLKANIDSCPWFNEKYKRVARLESAIKFRKHKATIMYGSQVHHSVGRDVFSFLMDEVNFFHLGAANAEDAQKRAQTIYSESRNRITSRFSRAGGLVAGISLLISSKRSTSAFLENHVKNSSKEIAAGLTMVSEYSQWEVKPHVFSTTTFKVEVGDRVYPSRILPPGTKSRDGARVVDVPDDAPVRAQFEKDIDQALRDLAGIATFGVAPLFRDRTLFTRATTPSLQHPFTRDEFVVTPTDDLQIHTFFKPEVLFKIENSIYTMRYHPQAPRFFHVDIGLKHDAAGISISHVAGIETVERMRPDGTKFQDMLPIVVPDITLRLVPQPGQEVSLEKIRTFFYHLRAMGMPLLKGSFDGYNSADSIQQMTTAGWEVELLSVDRNDEPYLMLKQSFIEGRIQMYTYPPLMRELGELEYDLDKKKVDHPDGKAEDGREFSKDVADSFCGSVYHCLTDIRARQSMAKLKPGWKGSTLFQEKRLVKLTRTSVPWSSMDKDRRTAQRTQR
jgi:hypothetical protein